jgi:hypothetical protein
MVDTHLNCNCKLNAYADPAVVLFREVGFKP